jgi:hypothetical protein
MLYSSPTMNIPESPHDAIEHGSTSPDHSGAQGVGTDAQGNAHDAAARRRMLERHAKK